MTDTIIQQLSTHLQQGDESKEIIQLLSTHINTISPTQLMMWLDSIIEKSYPRTIRLIEHHLISHIDSITASAIYPFVESAYYQRSSIGMRLLGAKKSYDDLLRYINIPAIRAKSMAIQILLKNAPHMVTINIIETNLSHLSPNELALWLQYAYQNRITLSDTHLSKVMSHFSEQAEGETYLELLAETIEFISAKMSDQEVMHHFYGDDAMLKEMSSWILATRFENGASETLIPEIKNALNNKTLRNYAQTALQNIQG